MSRKTIFDDKLTTAALAAAGTSQVLGPGRLARCERVTFAVHFGTTCTVGNAIIQASHHQDFPGVPEDIVLLAAPGAGDETVTAVVVGNYPFLRVKAGATINGNGIESVRATGF